MVAEVRLVKANEKPSVVVPPSAARIDEKGSHYLFVVKSDSKLEQRTVTIASYVGEDIAVSQGLSDGELIVISGTPMLANGMSVAIAERDAGQQ